MAAPSKSPRFVPPEERPTVRVKPHTYQPSKAELEADIGVQKPDGTPFTLDEAFEALMRPVKVVEDPGA